MHYSEFVLALVSEQFLTKTIMKKGIIQALLLYIIGFGSAFLYLLFNGEIYAHAPSPHHLMIALTILSGIIWLVIEAIIWLVKGMTKRREGVILTHGFFLIFTFVIISRVFFY